MTNNPDENSDQYPALGRAMMWVDKPGSGNKIFWGLAVACVVVFLLEFTYKSYNSFDIEGVPGFYGIFGFVMFSALVFASKALRALIKRPEDYYGDKAVDREEYPDEGLEKGDHHVE